MKHGQIHPAARRLAIDAADATHDRRRSSRPPDPLDERIPRFDNLLLAQSTVDRFSDDAYQSSWGAVGPGPPAA